MQRKETELHFLLLSQWVLDLMSKWVLGTEGSLLLSFLRRSRACDKLGILDFSSLEFWYQIHFIMIEVATQMEEQGIWHKNKISWPLTLGSYSHFIHSLIHFCFHSTNMFLDLYYGLSGRHAGGTRLAKVSGTVLLSNSSGSSEERDV